MARLGMVLLALLTVVVQTTLVPAMPGSGALLDLVFLLVVFFALQLLRLKLGRTTVAQTGA